MGRGSEYLSGCAGHNEDYIFAWTFPQLILCNLYTNPWRRPLGSCGTFWSCSTVFGHSLQGSWGFRDSGLRGRRRFIFLRGCGNEAENESKRSDFHYNM
jgi:hypothetical protein